MSTKIASKIKARILADLQTLIDSDPAILKAVVSEDLSKDPLQGDYPGFPVAVLGMSSIDAQYEENTMNARVYTFPILFMQKVDNLDPNEDSAMEDLRDEVLNKFDTDYTLGGTAEGGCDASVSPVATMSDADKTYLIFIVTIKAKAIYTIGT